jgi:hypothetical protein
VNEKANNSQVKPLAVNTSFSGVFSFITKALLNETYIIKALSQESNTTANPLEFETLMDKLVIDYRVPTKRLRRYSKRSHQL